MEYVCMIGMPSGEVVERTFAAPDETSLRTELEQKGYYLFSVRRGFVLKELGLGRPRVPTDLLLLFCMMFGLVSILVLIVIPNLQDFYNNFNVDLPLLTRLLMSFSTTMANHAVWIFLVAVGLLVAVSSWLRREGSGVILDRFLFRVPYLGPLMRMYATSQLARTHSALLAGGLPLVNAM